MPHTSLRNILVFLRRPALALLMLLLAAGFLSAAAPVSAAGSCVNPGGTDGCLSSINAAIAAAPAGATIIIYAGSYTENVVVNKAVTLRGQGKATIYPAVSNPNCGGAGGGTLCTVNNTVVLVGADNVTIAGLVIDGDNPHLHSGVSVGGADIDARNGIVSDFNSRDTTLNMVVRDTTVRNVFRRGIQITSNAGAGTFTFDRDTVSNVQGDPGTSVAIISNGNGNAGTMSNNTVSDSSDGLNSNYSHGITFLDNRITRSGAGVHTDNAGGAGGGSADLVKGNTVRDCQAGGIGLMSFVSYVAPAFQGNTVRNCDTGIAVYGTATAASPVFTNNQVTGTGAAGTVGALITTDLTIFGFGYFNVSATFTGNSFERSDTGIRVQQNGGKAGAATLDQNSVARNGTGIEADGATVTVSKGCVMQNQTGLLAHNSANLAAHQGSIAGNHLFGVTNANLATAPAVDAQNSWWGAPSGPAPAGKGDRISAGVNVAPFLAAPPAACGNDNQDNQDNGN